MPAFTPDQEEIPFARVNHNKYMVTDQAAYIGILNYWISLVVFPENHPKNMSYRIKLTKLFYSLKQELRTGPEITSLQQEVIRVITLKLTV